ncbi:hypothetical protein OUY22_24685 [Nonomuraea sp. MCN248]|uniref:Uncharacterized protein n=1 Tax=Nonomuraea corallina TaxID=2989783 RepID=A0ABT4SHC7_9ACTN|nr:hypothetical protein [Nonomuraea corallina]MDA0636621.1 hypothetical protein [Nonomuraea corallina]
MSDGSDKPKFAAGLGIAVSMITILAFFGIKSFDDLLNKDSSRSKACALAVAARNVQTITVTREEWQADALAYADRLLTAAEATDDPELRGSLRESVYAHQDWAAALRREQNSQAELERLQEAERKWAALCKVSPRSEVSLGLSRGI